MSDEDNQSNDNSKPADDDAYKAPATQADLDRIVGERLARERDKFKDYADLKKKAEAHDAALEAAKSDADKAVDAARKEGEAAATQASNARLVKAEARALAAQAGFRSLSDVNLLDLSDITVDETGEVDSKAVAEKLKALSESEPWRVDDGKKPRPQPDRAQGNGDKPKASVSAGQSLWDKRHPTRTST